MKQLVVILVFLGILVLTVDFFYYPRPRNKWCSSFSRMLPLTDAEMYSNKENKGDASPPPYPIDEKRKDSYEKELVEEPDGFLPYRGLAAIYYGAHYHKEAIPFLQRLIEPSSLKGYVGGAYYYHVFLADSYFRIGDYANSVKAYVRLKDNLDTLANPDDSDIEEIRLRHMDDLNRACCAYLYSGQRDSEAQKICDKRYLKRAWYWLTGLF